MGAYIVMAVGVSLVIWMIGWRPRRARHATWRVIIAMGGICVILAGASLVWPEWVMGLLTWLAVGFVFSWLLASVIGQLRTEAKQAKVQATLDAEDEDWLRQINISLD